MSQALGLGSTGACSASLGERVLRASRRLLGFAGPALLVSVGYVDPGNWATDLEGGSRFGYRLLWVLIASSTIAVLLQTLSARLAIVTGRNLAQACRIAYSPRVSFVLWALAELGIIACDSAEVVGSAIALNLLFGVPLVLGALLTALDVLVVLLLQERRLGVLELVIAALLLTITACLSVEMWVVRPAPGELLRGLAPRLPPEALYVAVGILGATLMPHNLYLQSSLVPKSPLATRQAALRRSWLSTAIGLNIALLLNVAILLLAAEAFSTRGLAVVDLRDAHRLLAPLLGSGLAAVLFAVGLLCSGQSATVTGTLAGQVVMEGFLRTRLSPVVRRALTRGAAVLPAVLILSSFGDGGTTRLLIGSQVVLSMQLPFAIIPLLRLTSSPRFMGDAATGLVTRYAALTCALAVCAANAVLLWKTFWDLRASSPLWSQIFAAACALGIALLAWISFVPLRSTNESRAPRGVRVLGLRLS